MKKGHYIRWFALTLVVLFAIVLVNNNISKMLFASGSDERIVFAYGKTMAERQEIAIFINEELGTTLEITTPTKEVSKLPVKEGMSYEVNANGTYIFRLLDQKGIEIVKVEQDFSNLKKIDVVEKDENWEIISRIANVDNVQVVCGEVTEIVSVVSDEHGNRFGTMAIPEIKTCRFTPLDKAGVKAGDSFDYTGKGKTEEVGVPLKKQINTAKDLHLITDQPDGIYELGADIDMSGMKTLNVILSGTIEGNGFQLYNMQQPLLLKMDKAEIKNLHLQGDLASKSAISGLALQANNTKIVGSSFQGSIVSEKEAAGFFLKGENNTIENSYVSAKIDAKIASAGFMLSGSGNVKESFVTGVIKSEENSYGFGKDVDASNSYVAAGILGVNQWMFNSDTKDTNNKNVLEACFYDASLNDFEEVRATSYSNTEITSIIPKMDTHFTITEGKYPQIKEEITKTWSERSRKSADLSVFTMPLDKHENMATLVEPLVLPETIDEQKVEWNSEGKLEEKALNVEVGETKEVKETILMAKMNEGTRYFAAQNAQLLASNDVIVGERAATTTTNISFNATDGYYYKVVKADEVVADVKNHKDAIEAGFKKRIGTGIHNVASLNWYTNYKVYETDLTSMSFREAKTLYGMLGGNVSVAGTPKVGGSLVASLNGTTTTSGTWAWYKSKVNGSAWDLIVGGTSSTQQISETELGYYIKVVFTADASMNIQDTIEFVQAGIVKKDLDATASILIKGGEEIGGRLTVGLSEGLVTEDFNIQWFQKMNGTEDKKIGSGILHDIVADDIGKQIYATATAKPESYYNGSIESKASNVIISLEVDTPTELPKLESTEDTTVSIRMPDTVKDGLYRFGYRIGTSDDFTEFPITVRGNNKLTITGLTPKSRYQFAAKRIGENGYLDSAWGNKRVTGTTGNQYIIGYVDLKGKAIFGETLTADFITEESDQDVTTTWYRVKDGKRVPGAIGTEENYKLNADDVGCKIEVEIAGVNGYGGFVRAFSETVVHSFISSPTGVVTENSKEHNAVNVKLPNLDIGMNSAEDKFIIGISDSESGYPIEFKTESGVQEFVQGENVKLTGLKPQTKYYIYLRYAMTSSHYRSDWSINKIAVETTTETFTGTISFSYSTNTDAVQGEKLSATVTSTNLDFIYDGTWEWVRIAPDNSEAQISNFYPEKDMEGIESKNQTYFMIPEGEKVGTKYRVKYTPNKRYTGMVSTTSNTVRAPIKEAYDAPQAPDKVDNTDSVINFRMPSTLDGIYSFGYASVPDISQIKELSATALAGATVSIDGLNRNTTYYIWSKRNSDDEKNASTWSTRSLAVKTDLGKINGYVTLNEDVSIAKEIKAVYNKALYTPSGNDENGTWTWYKNNAVIRGATSDTYTPVSGDLGAILKAVYTANTNDGFTGSKEAVTKAVRKQLIANPAKVKVVPGVNLAGELTISAEFNAFDNVMYTLRKASEKVPSLPTKEDINAGYWKQKPLNNSPFTTDYMNSVLESHVPYILYVVILETDDKQASSIVGSDPVSIPSIDLNGSVSISGKQLIGDYITATLNNSNNAEHGTWKWYQSTEMFPAISSVPDLNDKTQWEQIASGYAPTKDSDKSTLTLNESTLGHFIKVEYVSNEDYGYVGTVNKTTSSVIKKIYDESVTIEGKGYANEVITGKIVNNHGKLTDRSSVQFEIGSTIVNAKIIDDSTFTYTLSNDASLDGKKIRAIVATPTEKSLFAKPDGTALTDMEIWSSAETAIPFVKGIPITDANDLAKFIRGESPYNNLSEKYVVTNNIDMGVIPSVPPHPGFFRGELNFDFHTITGLQDSLFTYVEGTDIAMTSRAVVKNGVFKNSNVIATGKGKESDSRSVISRKAGSALFEKLLIVDSILVSGWDTGFVTGKAEQWVDLDKIATAGGSVSTTYHDTGLGGMIGYAYRYNTINNSYSINTEIKFDKGAVPQHMGGLAGSISKLGKNYVATKFDFANGQPRNLGGVVGSSGTGETDTSFYDQTLAPQNFLFGVYSGNRRPTQAMIGDKLAYDFGNDGTWTYKEGFYPRLSWIEEEARFNSPDAVNISNLYTATRGSFTSIDGRTDSNRLFRGELYGAIEPPSELLIDGYSYSSSNSDVLVVLDSGIILPKAIGTADLEILYTDKVTGRAIKNTFTFEVKEVPLKPFLEVKLSGEAEAGKTLTVTSNPSTSTYNWYRRKVGTFTKEKINGVTGSSYNVQYADFGYEIAAEAALNSYAPSISKFSTPVISGKMENPPTISNITDNGCTVAVNISGNTDIEYAFSTSLSGLKTIVDNKGASIDIAGMQRNTKYYVFARIATGKGYDAGSWSPEATFTTSKTALEGNITVTGNHNVGASIKMSISDVNLQEGEWKLERVNPNDNTFVDVTNLATNKSMYEITYPIETADIAHQLRIVYSATGDFKGSLEKSRTDIFKEKYQIPPEQPDVTEIKNTQINVEIKSPEQDTYYVFGYRQSLDDEIKEVTGSMSAATIVGLTANKEYYIYAKKSSRPNYEASEWSPFVVIKTLQSPLSGSMSKVGTEKVEETITFSVPDTNNQEGQWKLERFNDSSKTTLTDYTISTDGRTLTYVFVARDGNNKIKATFDATGDHKGSLELDSGKVSLGEQSAVTFTPEIISKSEYYVETRMSSGIDMYQFGYRKKNETGEIQLFNATTAVGKPVAISGLSRNTEYEFYVRKAAKIGYDAGAWNTTPVYAKTTLSPLNGNISFKGSAIVGKTIEATFNSNGYPQSGDDGKGTWKWYLDGTQLANTTNTITIPPFANGNPELKVVYEAVNSDGFHGNVSRIIGNVGKTSFKAPNIPSVSALNDDGTEGSKIKVTNTELDNIYYYVQSSDISSEPPLVLASEASATIEEGKWVNARANMIFNLDPNQGYQLFAARLENNTYGVSSIVTGKSIRTVKEELIEAVEDEDNEVTWKADQEKVLYYTQYGVAPTGTWSFFITKDKTKDWQNVDAQLYDVEQGTKDNQAYVKFTLPLKFTDYYVKAVFTGNQDYTGQKEYISRAMDNPDKEAVLIGKTMKGYVEITNPDTNELLVPINVQYVGDDEKNGIWTWYRETKVGSETFELINGAGNGGERSTYTPTAPDFNRNIYATYKANPIGQYSGEQNSDHVKQVQRSKQNKPDKVGIKEVNGTRILVTPPSNFNSDPDGTAPQVVLGYKEAKEKDDADVAIIWQLEANYGNNWFNNLKKNTAYVFYARYLGTPTYEISEISDVSDEGVTKNDSFIKASYELTRNKDIETSYIMDVGNSLTATYSGAGWDEGYFEIKRSNGDVIDGHVEPNRTRTNQASCSYTYQTADIGTHIIVKFVAKDDALYHAGSIVVATSEPVTKPVDHSMPIAPGVKLGDNTNLIVESVNANYEYAFTQSPDAPDMNSGDWNKLPVVDGAEYELNDLKAQYTYYLHVRIAETAIAAAGDKTATTGPLKIESSIDLGSITIKNVEDNVTIPTGKSLAIEVPNTILGETLTIKSVKMTKDNTEVSSPQTSVSEFVDGDKPHENVFTKGSDWGDQHFASDIQVVDVNGTILSSSNGNGTSLSGITPTSLIQLQMYRVNAIKQSGKYEWTCELEDKSGSVISYRAEINIETQIMGMMPIKLDMFIRDGVINQTSNTETLVNEGMMPISYQMDEFVQPGISMPPLLGTFNKPIENLTKNEVFMKVSSDGSNFTNPSGIWMRSTGEASAKPLLTLGAKSKSGYLISGISHKNTTWPWESVEDRVIEQAYLFHFIIDVSEKNSSMNQNIQP